MLEDYLLSVAQYKVALIIHVNWIILQFNKPRVVLNGGRDQNFVRSYSHSAKRHNTQCENSSSEAVGKNLKILSIPPNINEDQNRLDEWLNGNKPSLNVVETHSMLIAAQQKYKSFTSSNVIFDLKIRNNEIEIRNEANYLGVQIDGKLHWNEHKAASAKVSRGVVSLKYSKKYLSITTQWYL